MFHTQVLGPCWQYEVPYYSSQLMTSPLWSRLFRRITRSSACEQEQPSGLATSIVLLPQFQAGCVFPLPDLGASIVLPQKETVPASCDHQDHSLLRGNGPELCMVAPSPFPGCRSKPELLLFISNQLQHVYINMFLSRLSCSGHASRHGDHWQLWKLLSRPSCVGWSSS